MADLFSINRNDLEELFFDMSNLQNVFEKKLENLHINFPTSHLGSYNFQTERKGSFYLSKTKGHFHKNILSKGDTMQNIAIYFIKKGKGNDLSLNNEICFGSNSHNLLFMPEGAKMKGIYCKDVDVEATSLHFSKEYFKNLAEHYPEEFASSFLRYEKGEYFYLNNRYSATTPQMYQILWQLENNHLMGGSKGIYADAKALELFSLLFATERQQDYKLYEHCKTKLDYDKIQEAAYILVSNIHNSPTIRNLSLQVGINEKKLKYGFKEVFGVTIYSYLFEYKMSLAEQLLKNTDKSILEIAELCGYDYTSHFCTAFKRRFGKSPKKIRI